MKTLAEALFEYYQQNKEDFNHDIEELDSLNGWLGDDKIIPMDELDKIYQGKDATEILRCAYFGHDDDNWHEENGERVYGEFNPNRDYVYFVFNNGYGNLVSTDYRDYSKFLDDNFVQAIIDEKSNLDLSDGAYEIIENYDGEGEDDEN
jgi:hypothetical protein